MIRIYLIAGVLAAITAAFIFARWDAVRDFKTKLEAERTGHIQDAREIENETRTDADDALIDCLSGRGC